MSRETCDHQYNKLTCVCPHVFDRIAISEGVKTFTGLANEAEYLCYDCSKQQGHEKKYLCEHCIAEIESYGDWSIQGTPEIKRNPQAFVFSRREITITTLVDCDILAFSPLFNSPSEALVFTSQGHLYLVDIVDASTHIIAEFSNDVIDRLGRISLNISNNNRFISITSRPTRKSEAGRLNSGVVVELTSGNILMKLECGDYHTNHTPFPVTFIEHMNQTLLFMPLIGID